MHFKKIEINKERNYDKLLRFYYFKQKKNLIHENFEENKIFFY